MIREKTNAETLGFHELVLSCFLTFPESKQLSKNRSTSKHAVVNTNKFSNQNRIKNREVVIFTL